MSELEIDVRNDTRYRVDEDAVAELARAVLQAEGVAAAELGISFIGELRMRSLNRAHRDADYVTDVLAFPLEDPAEVSGGVAGEALGDRGVAGEALGDREVAGEGSPAPRLLGDVVVCLRRAERQAAQGGLPLSLETAVLLVHGILHILGYDHEIDAGDMALRQGQLLERVVWQRLVVPAPGRAGGTVSP